MKAVVYILLLLTGSSAYAQSWRDTLTAARKSYLTKDYERSYRLYRSATKLAPKEIDLSDEVAQSAYKAGKYAEAEKIYGQSSSNKGSATQKGMISRQIGNAQMKQEKYGEAIESYKESLRNNPKDEYSRYNLAEAMRRQKAKQDKQQQQSKQPQSGQQPQDPKNQDKQNNTSGNQDQQGKQNKPEQEKQQDQSGQQSGGSQQAQQRAGEGKSKLSDKKTERMLDDLMKQEMQTKRRFEGMKSTVRVKRSGKDW